MDTNRYPYLQLPHSNRAFTSEVTIQSNAILSVLERHFHSLPRSQALKALLSPVAKQQEWQSKGGKRKLKFITRETSGCPPKQLGNSLLPRPLHHYQISMSNKNTRFSSAIK